MSFALSNLFCGLSAGPEVIRGARTRDRQEYKKSNTLVLSWYDPDSGDAGGPGARSRLGGGKGQVSEQSKLVRDAVRRLLEERELVEQRHLSEEARKSIRKAREQDGSYTLEQIREELDLE